MAQPGPGHNSVALPDPGLATRIVAWRSAIAAQKKPSPQVMKMMIARAQELGLSYSDYWQLTRSAGRDIGAYLFTSEGLRLRMGRRLEMPEHVRARLAQISACRFLALTPDAEHPDDYLAELREVSGLPFSGVAPLPHGEGWSSIRAALHPAFSGLPSSAVALVAAQASEARLVAAANLAGMMRPEALFGA